MSADGRSARNWLEGARDLVTQAERALADSPPQVSELHRAVDGAMQVTAALAGLIDLLIRHAPTALREYRDPYLLKDLVGDLRAVHGCLANTPLLLAPARDDLGALTAARSGPGAALSTSDLSVASVSSPAVEPEPAAAAADGVADPADERCGP